VSDREQIIDVLTRYATGIDSCDWELFRSCWADEVDLDYGDVGHFTDPNVLTTLFSQLHDPMGPTYHRLSNFVIAVDEAGDTATGRTYVNAVLMLTPGDGANWVEATGHYDDEFVRTADGWRIRRRVAHTPRILTGGPQAAVAAAAGIPHD
jgi:3-phenylpropionate/cinnamic acid dioxygenase small subunit